MKNSLMGVILAGAFSIALAAGGVYAGEAEALSAEQSAEVLEPARVTVFAAKSLNSVMEALIEEYNRTQPEIEITGNYDSSGTLMVQIEEGAECDIFFPAAEKQMDELEEKEFVVPETRSNVVNNQVCVVTYKNSGTKVTGLSDIGNAASFALADGSVPVGRYTREALVNAGLLEKAEDVSAITTEEVSAALGGIEINECANVGAALAAVAEGANEVGTIYYSDTKGFEDVLDILEFVPYELTGNVIYPVAEIVNPEADDAEKAAADDFLAFLTSDRAKAVYEEFYFDTNVE